MYSVAMITAPRPVNYVSRTLGSLFDSGFTDVTVFEEPGVVDYLHNSEVTRIKNDVHLGCVFNWLSALDWMVRNKKPPFIICEDDFEITTNRLDTELKMVIGFKDVGFVSPYCSKANSHGFNNAWGSPRMGGAGWCGALFMLLSEELVGHIHRNIDLFVECSYSKKRKPLHLDTAIGLMASNFANFTHVPTFILHIGEESTHPMNNTFHGKTHFTRQPA